MPPTIVCTITLTEVSDEKGEDTLRINVSHPFFQVPRTLANVAWRIDNQTNARTLVKLRGFRNITVPGVNDDPCNDRTPRRKLSVDGGSAGNIAVDMNGGTAGHRYKYNIHIGKVLAVDPELELM